MMILWLLIGAIVGFLVTVFVFANTDGLFSLDLYKENKKLKATIKKLRKELETMRRWANAFSEQLCKYQGQKRK